MSDKNTKIVILFWDLGMGGIQKRILHMVKYLNNKKIPTTLILKRCPINTKNTLEKKYPYLNINSFSHKSHLHGYKVLFACWLLITISRNKPTTILAFLNRFALIGVIYKYTFFWRKVKTVISQEILLSAYFQDMEPSYWKHIGKIVYSLSDVIIVQTKACKDDLIRFLKLRNHNIKVINNWITYKVHPNTNSIKRFDAAYVGRITDEKRVDLILKAIISIKKKYYKNVSLAIIGTGQKNKVESLKKLINHPFLENQVTFLGYQKNPIKIIKQSKVLTLASTYESSPNVILEAYSQKVPVITTNFKGAKELIINEKTGLIVNNQNDYPAKLLEIVFSKKYKVYGENGFSFLKKKFNTTNMNLFMLHLIKK